MKRVFRPFLDFVKSKILLCVLTLALVQNKAFAVATNSISDIHYKMYANSINLAPIVVMAAILLIVLVAYYKISRVEKYECFSLKCKKCGSFTRGLKCVACQSQQKWG